MGSLKFLITGANGFLGQPLCAELQRRGQNVLAATRSGKAFIKDTQTVVTGEVNAQTDWSSALQGIDVVIHLAARVHVMKDNSENPLEEFRKVNLHGTENLARQAARAGVKRLVYVSSIKVNGESTALSTIPSPVDGRGELTCFSDTDTPNPQDPYGVSKWEAEQALHRVSEETGLEVVVVRPPLVYGPGVKGNFISLLTAIYKGIPLPLAGAKNARSLVYVGNLVDALIVCATHPEAAGKTYLVSDGKAVSTADLAKEIAAALECADRTFYFPPTVLRTMARLLGKSAQVDRLFGSLRINSQKIRNELGWTPPYTLQQGLRETASWYRGIHS